MAKPLPKPAAKPYPVCRHQQAKPAAKPGQQCARPMQAAQHQAGPTLAGEDAQRFEQFWKAFELPSGRYKAELAWLELPEREEQFERILAAARAEAARRPELDARKQIPKQAAGWLSERRFLDYEPPVKREYSGPEMYKPLTGEARARADAAMKRCMDRWGIKLPEALWGGQEKASALSA